MIENNTTTINSKQESLEDLLIIKGISKVYKKDNKEYKVLEDINFKIKKGEMIGIVGESGSGKSTLARQIIRLEKPTSGQVLLNNKDITNIKGKELKNIYKDMQMVFQDTIGSFDPRLTIGKSIDELLKNNKAALDRVRSVYRYILVDEFQDINKVQFEALKLIANPSNNIFVVGDEDQSIYGFRGSRPDFLLEFEEYFSNTKKVLLDINYRSKGEIINIANRLIEKNTNRYEKVIKCGQGNGAKVNYISPEDSEEEAVYIAKDIKNKVQEDYTEYTDFAVIYRTNIQSRALVDVFMDMRIPFVVKDSIVTIYDHWAAQDILAYLRIGVNPNSNKDWIRIINKPFRYISKDNLNLIKDEPDFINSLINKCDLHPKQVKTINDLDIDISYVKGLNPKNAISYIRTTLDYDRYILDYCANRKIKTNGLIEILNELESSATNFKTIQEYLEHIERVKSEIVDNKNNKETDGVIFTTMHSAKGLEFKNVYIIGANEGTIPHEKSYEIDDEEKKNDQIEEERRLMYVAITRAEENICISSPINKYGKRVSKSRFVEDIKAPTKKEMDSLTIGDRIYHKKFKEGTIVEKNGDSIKIRFKDRDRALNSKVCLTKRIIWKI